MNDFTINPLLIDDTHPVLENAHYWLGLHKNALFPWLILVPKTKETELFACPATFKTAIREAIDSLAAFSQSYFQADKMNIATLGNVVSQLHVHIIARKHDDPAWPTPIWGNSAFLAYEEKEKDAIIAAIQKHLHA